MVEEQSQWLLRLRWKAGLSAPEPGSWKYLLTGNEVERGPFVWVEYARVDEDAP